MDQTTKRGDIPLILCNQHGNKLDQMIMKDVAIVPTSVYNPFSLTEAKKGECTLSGRDKKLTVTKGSMKSALTMQSIHPKA